MSTPPREHELARAVSLLRAGELVAFPTETVYGLGADATNPAAIAKIYALKGRPPDHPVIVHLAPDAALSDWAAQVPAPLAALARVYWPGPLTLVLPRAPGVCDALTGGQDTIGLRKPSHPVAIELLSRFAGGIAAPSANRYGRISPTRAAHVHDEFGARAPLVLDGGDCAVGLESTIVGWVEGAPALLRPGQIGLADLRRVAGEIRLDLPGGAPRVSGSHLSHYAPATPTFLVAGATLEPLATAGVAVLSFAAVPHGYAGPLWIHAPPDPLAYGQALYANLRRLDAAKPLKIMVESVPDSAAWDAVRDRLRRAAQR